MLILIFYVGFDVDVDILDPSDDPSVNLDVSHVQVRRTVPEGHSDDDLPVAEGDQQGFQPNFLRGCSWSYDWGAVNAFLKANSFRGILRAHSVQVRGFQGDVVMNIEPAHRKHEMLCHVDTVVLGGYALGLLYDVLDLIYICKV